MLDSFRQDVKQTFRNLVNAPVFLTAVVLTLAVAVGANTAIFSIVKTVLLEPLPYPDADRLLAIDKYPWNPAEIVLDLKQTSNSFEGIAAYYPRPFAVAGGDQPYQVEGARVTPDFLRLFRAEIAMGRNFEEDDVRGDASRTAIVSYGVWQRRYAGSPDVIGQPIRINGELHEIVGVLERGFRQYTPETENPGLWIPFEVAPTNTEGLNDGINYAIALGRLKEGATLQQAQAELDVVMNRFRQRHPAAAGSPRWNLQWTSLQSGLIQNVRPALLLLQLAVGAVLLIACVNVANLLLARVSSRRTDIAVRAALGASKGRLLRYALTESVMISVLGGAAGLLLMAFGLRLVLALAPGDIPRIDEVSIDRSVLLFTLSVSIAIGLLFGVIPALAAIGRGHVRGFLENGRRSATSKSESHLGHALVVAEVAMALILLAGAGLLGRSFMSLTAEDPGFRSDNVLAVSLQIPENRFGSVSELGGFYGQLMERLRQVPGIESVGFGKNMPLSRGNSVREYRVDGAAETGIDEAHYDVIGADYFRTLGIPLLKGRYFENSDRRDSLPVATIDEAMWHDAWPDEDPIGKRFHFAGRWLTVVGVVGNIRGSGLASDPRPGFYISYRQRPETPTALAVGRNSVILVRTRVAGENLSDLLRQAIWDVDPQQPVANIATLESVVANGVNPERFRMALMGIFAAIALILVILGIYGVISYTVTRQTQEIGIRMALGARRARVQGRVIARTIGLTSLGLLIGLVGAAMLTRFLDSMLYGVSPTDPSTFVAISALLLGVALLAGYFPSRRAARVDPMQALRQE